MPTSIPVSVEAPPLTFEDAERRSPFGQLIELYEQATFPTVRERVRAEIRP